MSTLNVSNITDGTDTVGTSYVLNGSAKCWLNLNGDGTISLRDSLNISSTTDDSTGNYSASFTSNMDTINYIVNGTVGGNNDYYVINTTSRATYAITSTSSMPVKTRRISDNAAVDNGSIFAQVHGDLA